MLVGTEVPHGTSVMVLPMGIDVKALMDLLAVASGLGGDLCVASAASDFNCPAPLPQAALAHFQGAYSTQTVNESYQAIVLLGTNDPSVIADPGAFATCGWQPLSQLKQAPASPVLAYCHPAYQLVLRINVGIPGEDPSWWRIDGALTYVRLVTWRSR